MHALHHTGSQMDDRDWIVPPLAGSEYGSFAHGTITARLPAIVGGMISDMEAIAASTSDIPLAAQLCAATAEIGLLRSELLSASTALPADLDAPPGA